VPKGEKILKNMTKQVWENLPKVEQVWESVPKVERVLESVPKVERVLESVPKVERVLESVPKHEKECKSLIKYAIVNRYWVAVQYKIFNAMLFLLAVQNSVDIF
jgi:hypothetical protein